MLEQLRGEEFPALGSEKDRVSFLFSSTVRGATVERLDEGIRLMIRCQIT